MTLGLFLFAAKHYAFLLFIAAAACALGGRCLRRVHFQNPLERFVFSSLVGLGALATLTFLLGLASLLHAPVMIFALLAMVATGFPELRKTARAARNAVAQARWWEIALAALVLALGSPLLLLPLYPPIQWDATSYHFPVAGMYARAHELYFTPYLRSPVFPQLNELLFTIAFLLYDDIAAQLIQLLFLLLSAATLICWARRLGAPAGAGVWAAALWISSPLVMMLGSAGYIEMSLTAYLTAGALAVVVWKETEDRHWLMMSAALFAFAAASKYLALFPILMVGLFLIYRAARARFSGASIADVWLFASLVVIIAVPWHARITWFTGNPVWPYAARLLGAGPWPIEQIQSLLRDQFNPADGTGMRAIALLPFNLTFHIEKFAGELPLTPLLLFLLPVSVFIAGRHRGVRLLLAIAALYMVFWFYTAQNLRYMVHAMPLLCLSIAVSLAELLAHARKLYATPAARAVLAAAGCIALAAPGYELAKLPSRPGWLARPADPPPITAEGRTAFISAIIPEYTAIDHLNRTLPGGYTLYSFPNSSLAGYVNGTFVGDWYGPARYDEYISNFDNPEGMYQFLRRHGVTHVLMGQRSAFGAGHSDEMMQRERLPGHLKMIYAAESVVYEVVEEAVRPLDTPELLTNGELELPIEGGVPPGWSLRNQPHIDTSGTQGWNSATAVGTTGSDWIEQTVPVEPEAIYIFRVLARHTEDPQWGAHEVEWLDAAGNRLAAFTRQITGPVDWYPRATAVTAPPGAARARIQSRSTGPNLIWFDHFTFKKLAYE